MKKKDAFSSEVQTYNIFLTKPIEIFKTYSFIDDYIFTREFILNYFDDTKFIKYFVLLNREPRGETDYETVKNNLLNHYKNNNFELTDRMLKTDHNTYFEFNWIPNSVLKHINSSIFETCIFWKFTKVNLLFRMCSLNMDVKLKVFIKKNLNTLYKDILLIEEGNFKFIKPFHEKINMKDLNTNPIEINYNIFYRSTNKDFWNTINFIKSKNKVPFNKETMKITFQLMKSLNLNSSKFKNKANYSLVLTTFFLISRYFKLFRSDDIEFCKIWSLIPFLNFLCYQNFPTDESIINGNLSYLKYIPIFQHKSKDNIFDISDYLGKAMAGSLPYTSLQTVEPIIFILRISLPIRFIKKNRYKNIINYYKKFDNVKRLLDSCIINSIVGLYPDSSNKDIYKDITDVKLILKFYNDFVFNPNKVDFIKKLCDNQNHFKWLIRQIVIYTIKNNIALPITTKYWNCIKNENSNKLSLTFTNFMECNKKNILNYRKFYLFKTKINNIHETVKKKKEVEFEKTISDEILASIKNGFILDRFFDVPIKYNFKLKNHLFNYQILDSINKKDLFYYQKLEYFDLCKDDIELIKQIETIFKNSKTTKSDIRALVEKISKDGKIICFKFFNFITKVKKIKFFDLNPLDRLLQLLMEAFTKERYFEKVVYTLCCDLPRICNIAGHQNANDNESGLNQVSMGINNELFCSKHLKSKESKNHEMILFLLKKNIIEEIKKMFKYISNRTHTFQLYKYIYTGNPSLPEWFKYEYDDDVVMKEKEGYVTFENIKKSHIKKVAPKNLFLIPKVFSFPVTRDRDKIKEILIKIITTNKIQLKTIFNKRTKYLLEFFIIDNKTIIKNLNGQYIVIETKKKSKKKKKKKKNATKQKKNDRYLRVFRLCENCREIKIFNEKSLEVNNYMCKNCAPKEVVDTNKSRKMYLTLDSFIPYKIL